MNGVPPFLVNFMTMSPDLTLAVKKSRGRFWFLVGVAGPLLDGLEPPPEPPPAPPPPLLMNFLGGPPLSLPLLLAALLALLLAAEDPDGAEADEADPRAPGPAWLKGSGESGESAALGIIASLSATSGVGGGMICPSRKMG